MLSCADLSFSYGHGTSELFGGLSHNFTPGAITAISGVSGRGKSTLLYVLGLMLRPNRGNISFAGKPVSQLPDNVRAKFRARSIGFVFQDSALDTTRRVIDSIVEPAIYAGINRDKALIRARELAEQIGVNARLDHRPGAISGGEAQRVALCRALLVDPQIILADEPTGNLDADNSAIVLDLLRFAADAGKTVVVATHDPFLAGSVDEVVQL